MADTADYIPAVFDTKEAIEPAFKSYQYLSTHSSIETSRYHAASALHVYGWQMDSSFGKGVCTKKISEHEKDKISQNESGILRGLSHQLRLYRYC